MKLAFWILCFASLMGKVNDAKLRGYVVMVLTWKEFSVDWLANKSVELIQSHLNVLGKFLYFAKILKDVAEVSGMSTVIRFWIIWMIYSLFWASIPVLPT